MQNKSLSTIGKHHYLYSGSPVTKSTASYKVMTSKVLLANVIVTFKFNNKQLIRTILLDINPLSKEEV